ncbi:hypothetical protein evm_012342 [Chilo suppressalis]|nr:hypothetical protein evm_012342 [Chilo suppressalis]
MLDPAILIVRRGELVAAQSRELRSLRGSVHSPRSLVDAALHAHTDRTATVVRDALSDGFERISRMGEAASSRAAQAAGVGAARGLEPLVAALHHELATKLTATDHLLRENIDKLANSKLLMEKLSTSIAKSLSEMVREQFREAIMASVVPVVEKAHAQMFRQINAAFQAGTKEFAANTEAAARAAAERGGAAATAQLKAALERHGAALERHSHALSSAPHYTAALQEAAHRYTHTHTHTTRGAAATAQLKAALERHGAALERHSHALPPTTPPRCRRPRTGIHTRTDDTRRRCHRTTEGGARTTRCRARATLTRPLLRPPLHRRAAGGRAQVYTHAQTTRGAAATVQLKAALERHGAALERHSHALSSAPHYTAALQEAAHRYTHTHRRHAAPLPPHN